MNEKRGVVSDPYLFAHDPVDRVIHLLTRPAEINVRRGVIVEHPKASTQMQIHADSVDPVSQRARFDADSTFFQSAFDVLITQPHQRYSPSTN